MLNWSKLLFWGKDTPYSWLYEEALPEMGAFFAIQVYVKGSPKYAFN